MADKDKKKIDISGAISSALGGGGDASKKDKIKAMILLTFFVFGIIFFIIPFIIGMGFEFFQGGFDASFFVGAALALSVVMIGGSKLND